MFYRWLEAARPNEPLAAHTTWRIGGPAEWWLAVESLDQLVEAAVLARQHQIPVFILGSGANLLIGEAGIRGLVIKNRAGDIERRGETVIVESGAMLPGLARRCATWGLSGLEWAIGIPGTIGGAVVNNAGAYGGDMAHTVRRVELLSPAGERLWQPVEWLAYDYRTSRLKRSDSAWIVLRAELGLKNGPPAEIEARLNGFNRRRKAAQPPGATGGSVFKNPPGDYAGRLIEVAGLKGHQIGQVRVSPVHANFFENLGGAAAGDVLALIETVREQVKQQFGITLALEIEVIGE